MALPGDIQASAESSYRTVDSPHSDFQNQQLALDERRPRGILFDILTLFRRHWQLVGAVWLLVVAAASAHAIFSIPTYTATGAVQVSAKDGLGAANPLLELAGGGGRIQLQTEVEIMRRKEFLLGTLRSLKLQVIDPNQPRRHSTNLKVTLGGDSPVDPRLPAIREAVEIAEIPGYRNSRTKFLLRTLHEDQIEVTIITRVEDEEQREIRVVNPGELLSHPKLTLQFSKPPLPRGQSIELAVLSDGSLYNSYKSRLQVTALGTQRQPTSMAELTLADTDREMSARIVQHHMERYLELSLAWQAQRASRSAEFIRGQLEELGVQLEREEERLRAFAESRQAVDLETQARVTIESGATIEAERSAVDIEEQIVNEVNRRLRNHARKRRASDPLAANFSTDPMVAEAVKNLNLHELEVTLLGTTLAEGHPQLKLGREQLTKERKEISKLLETVRRNLAARRNRLEAQAEQLKSSLAELPEKQLEFSRLTRSVEVSQRVYGFLLEKLQESEIMEAATTTDKRIVDAATPPHVRSSPKRGKIIGVGMVLGLMMGLGAAYLYSTMHQRLATVEAVREIVDYPVYATIPKIDAPEDARVNGRLTVDWIWKSPHDPAPEAFRTLRVNVGFVPAAAGRGRVLQITSSEPSEGKSTVLSNLAVSLVKSGARVLIIDLDLRRPVQHRIWQLSRSPGYSEYSALAGEANEREFIQHLDEHGIDIIPASKKVPETLSSIMSPALPRLLRKLAEQYDYVLIDSPPVFVSDAVVVAPFADLLMVTARPGQLHRSKLSHAVDLLSRVETTPKGLILNGVSREHSDYYSSGYYYYSGGYYSSNDDDDDDDELPVAANNKGESGQRPAA